MRALWVKLVVVGLAVALVSPAMAQRPGQPGGGRGGARGGPGGGRGFNFIRGGLLTNAQVQDELKLSDSQKEKIGKIVEEISGKYREDIQKAFESRDFAKIREVGEKGAEAVNKALEPIKKDLKPEQQKRLRQIELQQMNLNVYKEADVQKALDLKPAQKEKITAMLTEVEKEREKLFGGGGRPGAGGFNREAFELYRNMTRKAEEKINELLTAEQTTAKTELLGKPFEMRRGGRPGGAGGDRPARPGRPGGDRPARPDF